MHTVLAALAARRAPPGRIALVAAHPDDETIGASLLLATAPDLLLVTMTDGAPAADARRLGFTDAAAYAAARRVELVAALAVAGSHARPMVLGLPDQGATAAMHGAAARLRALFEAERIETVMTHPYEGGHPDHDATAFAVHRASTGPVLEMTSYHARPDGGLSAHCFLQQSEAVHLNLTPAEADRKRRMFGCFGTQQEVLAGFSAEHEAYRIAPQYDFSRPPHDGPLYYDRFPWGMTGERWRGLACP